MKDRVGAFLGWGELVGTKLVANLMLLEGLVDLKRVSLNAIDSSLKGPQEGDNSEPHRSLFFNVIISQGTPIFQPLTREDQPLLLGKDPLLILDLSLHIANGGQGLHL
jgi:hypothetical protein